MYLSLVMAECMDRTEKAYRYLSELRVSVE